MTKHSARRSRRPWLVVVVAFLAGIVAPSLGVASAEEEMTPELGGYRGNAMGWAFSLRPVLPALLPTGDVPFEVTVALTSANVTSGGNSFARASSLWPGGGAANLGPLLYQARPEDLGPIIKELMPAYPGVAEASAHDGTVEKGIPPAMPIVATGTPEEAEAKTRIPDVDIPGFLRIDSVASRSDAKVTKTQTLSESEVILEGVSLLDDHVKIQSVHSLARTASDGTKSVSDGNVEVAGLTVGGVHVGVDSHGITAPDQGPIPGVDATEAANAVLKQLGISLSLTTGSGGTKGGVSDRVSNGLLVSLANPVSGVGPVAVPPGRFEIVLASTAADSLASPPYDTDFGADVEDTGAVDDLTGDGSLGGSGGDSFAMLDEASPSTVAGLLDSVGAGMPEPGAAPAVDLYDGDVGGAPKPISNRFGGLPVSLVLVLSIVTIFAARFLRDVMGRLLPARAGTGSRKE